MHPWKNFKIITYLLVSTLLFVIGVISIACSETFLNVIIKHAFVLKPDSKVFFMWKKNPLPLKMDFYFFNWTNPEDINNSSVKPKFQQVGPYRFVETKEKVNVTWNKNNSVTFNQLRYWYFDKNSPRNLTDRITSLNAVSLVSCAKLSIPKYFRNFLKNILESLYALNLMRLKSVKTKRQKNFFSKNYKNPDSTSLFFLLVLFSHSNFN